MALKLDFSKVLVKDNTNRTTKAESDILQQAELIALRVTTETFNAMANTVASHEASISLQAQQIALKVASTDFTGATIASLINQSAAEVKIQASKITLEGLVTANEYFKILADGSIEAVNAKLSGSITATRISTSLSSDFYAELGQSNGSIGLGLFDLRYSTNPYCTIAENAMGTGFGLRDQNGTFRFNVDGSSVRLLDTNSHTRVHVLASFTELYSPDSNVKLSVGNNGVFITKNNVVIGSWGY